MFANDMSGPQAFVPKADREHRSDREHQHAVFGLGIVAFERENFVHFASVTNFARKGNGEPLGRTRNPRRANGAADVRPLAGTTAAGRPGPSRSGSQTVQVRLACTGLDIGPDLGRVVLVLNSVEHHCREP